MILNYSKQITQHEDTVIHTKQSHLHSLFNPMASSYPRTFTTSLILLKYTESSSELLTEGYYIQEKEMPMHGK